MTTRTERTLIVFPTYVGILLGVNAIELGARKAWVHTTYAGRVSVDRQGFSAEDLANTDQPASALAMKARTLADAAH